MGPVHLGDAILIAPPSRPPTLGFLSPMEREEAARSGLALLTPEQLDVPRWLREGGRVALLVGVLGRALQHCGIGPGRLALTGRIDAGTTVEVAARLADLGWSCVDGQDIVSRRRKAKSTAEIDEIRRVASGTTEAFCAVAGRLRGARLREGALLEDLRPLTVGDLRRTIAEVLARHGLEQPEGNLVAPAGQGAVPHNTGDDGYALRAGESLIVDIFPRGRLFADCTRTFCVGEPPEALAAAHADVHDALMLAYETCRVGALGWDLQRAVCDHFEALGHPTAVHEPGTVRGYVHGLGHGVGYEVHEEPSFREGAGDAGVLEVGDVLTLEPGLYEPEGGYAVRLEDTLVLGADGVEVLTDLPYDLDPRAY